jgi:cobalt-zinc-cadmium resistance protein CzcA
VRDAALEVRRPTLFGELIIMIVYLPILALEGVEGKLFQPMALTVIFALVGSMALSLTLMPVLCSLALPRRPGHGWLLAPLTRAYRPMLAAVLRAPRAGAGAGAGGAGQRRVRSRPSSAPSSCRGCSEGTLIVINTIRLAAVALDESVRYGTQIERALLAEFPDEIEHIWTRTGTPRSRPIRWASSCRTCSSR